jgi:hypothetical protein
MKIVVAKIKGRIWFTIVVVARKLREEGLLEVGTEIGGHIHRV